ncbi:aromatic-ring hydroxylase C-terminal domain-containing protein [[Actinomadura] parvosata]|uniref:aromatic-ring hydroxylase C-terminal domain-containing protein n=1 Tax=[Actinomadura] parvosata TaxID=1955412 RepID=UPI00406C9763
MTGHNSSHKVVVIGGGYAGTPAANRLRVRDDVAVTLVDPRPEFVERIRPRREVLDDLIGIDDVRLRLAGMITATGLRYPMHGTDLLGHRMPDLDLDRGRVHDLLHHARAVLLDLGDSPALDGVVAGWAGRVDLIRAHPVGGSELGAVLIRPDGHVAWVTRDGQRPDLDTLRTALTTWLGPGTR